MDYTYPQYGYIVDWPMLSELAQDYRRYLIVETDTLPSDDVWLSDFNTLLNVAMYPDTLDYSTLPFVLQHGIESYKELFEVRLSQVLEWYRFPDEMYSRLESIELLDISGNTKIVLVSPLLYNMSN